MLKVLLSTFILHVVVSLDFHKSGDVIIGQLLPVYQSFNGLKCARPDLVNIIKVEALIFAVKELSSSDLNIGYDVMDVCSEATSSVKLNAAIEKWFKEEKNLSRIPVAIITDLERPVDFHSLATERNSQGKDMPLISLQYRKKLWDNAYSMSPEGTSTQRAVFALVQHFKWDIVDIIRFSDDEGFENFKEISKNSELCLLNELSFIGGDLKWLKKGKKDAPVSILFSKEERVISSFVDALPSYNFSDSNVVLGRQVSQREEYAWKSNMAGVVGIRRNYGKLDDFEKYLKNSPLFEEEVTKSCLNITTEDCGRFKTHIIRQNLHKGAAVIDAVYIVVKSLQSDSNRVPKTGLTGTSITSATGRVVSFDSEKLTLKEIAYDVLNFRGAKFVEVGKIEFGSSVKVSVNDEIVWRHQMKDERCSADCAPGTWKKPWNEAEKCCWDCIPCAAGTVSSYANSTQCVKCPAGTKPTSDQTKCQPPYIDYLKWHDPFSLIMIFLLAFTICFVVYTVNISVKKAHTPVFLRSKSASLPLLLSLFVTFVLPILLLVKPTQSSCGAYTAIFMLSLGLPLTFLISRSHVVLNYCYGDDGELKRKWFHCSPQTVISLVLIILQVIIVVIILAVVPPDVLTLTTSQPDVHYIECASHSRPEFLPLVFFILVLIMVFNILHINEVSSSLNHNEVKFVSRSIYLLYGLVFVYFVAVFGINGKKKIRVLCGMAYLFGINFFLNIFLPKIYVILFRPEENLPDVSRLFRDENGNRDASRLSKKECVESPLLGLQAGPYDRTEV